MTGPKIDFIYHKHSQEICFFRQIDRWLQLAQPLLEHVYNSGCHKRAAGTKQHYFCDEQHAFIHIIIVEDYVI